MDRSLTKYDLMFLFEVLIAIIINEKVLQLSIQAFLLLVLIGLFFETATNSFWTYSEEFRRSLLTVAGTDISIAAAFSWAGVLTICINLSALLKNMVSMPYEDLIISVAVVTIIGNILETVCVKWGMFTYDTSWITRMIFFKKSIYLWDVPLMVRIGYFTTFGPLCAIMLHWSSII